MAPEELNVIQCGSLVFSVPPCIVLHFINCVIPVDSDYVCVVLFRTFDPYFLRASLLP